MDEIEIGLFADGQKLSRFEKEIYKSIMKELDQQDDNTSVSSH